MWDNMTLNPRFLQLLLWCAVCICICNANSTLQCTSKFSKEMKFVLTSQKYETGHWKAQIQLDLGGYKGEDGPYEIQLQHNTNLCLQDTSLIHLEGTVTELPSIPEPPAGDYIYFSGFGYYKLYRELMTWKDAKEKCESDGSHLAIVNSKKEATVLLKIFAENLDIHKEEQWDDQSYIGVSDIDEEKTFITIFGEPLASTGYARWAPSEPNNKFGGEDCVTIRRNARLNDVACTRQLTFFCEKEIDTLFSTENPSSAS